MDDHPDLEDGSTVQVDLTLPNGAQTMKIEVEVRHVQEFGERTRVGLRFGHPQRSGKEGNHARHHPVCDGTPD